jgi:proline iminopeptidase
MMSVLKWLLGGIGVVVALVVTLFVATRGDYSVATLVTDDSTLPSQQVAGFRLHMRTVDGPPDAQTVIVLHGGAGGDFRSLLGLSALSDAHNVVFYDQRGAGLSERVTADRLTLDGYLEELDAVIALTSPDRPVVLIGHSWGAMLASAYMGAHPDRVDRAVLIEPGYLDAEGLLAWGDHGAAYLSGGPYLWQAILNGFRAAHVTGPDGHASDDFLIGQMVRVFTNHPENPYHCGAGYTAPSWRFGALASAEWRHASPSDLDRIARGTGYQGPVLFLAGGCNDWTGAPLQSRHAARFADGRLEIVPEAGHDVIWDNPGAALPVIRAFLDDGRTLANRP